MQEALKPGTELPSQMQKQGVAPRSSTPNEFAAYLKSQNEVWNTALKESGVEPQ